MSCLGRMIFVTGFARGGTSWLRTCIASHPDVQQIPTEMPIFRTLHSNRAGLEEAVSKAIEERGLTGPWFVNKAPANAPYVAKTARTLPESKFVFIVRDPRDVFISHKRGNQAWMKGSNSTVAGCMDKIQKYFAGYCEGIGLPNLLLVRYEDLHQDFHATLKRVFDHIGLPSTRELLEAIHGECNFLAMTSRQSEDRDSPNRKGVVGDWVNFLEPSERAWYEASPYWTNFMRQLGYDWNQVTYESILRAMKNGGVESLDVDAMLAARLQLDRPNVFLVHDVDLLKTPASRQSVLALAKTEGELGLAGVFNFLPLDDMRYRPLSPEEIVGVARDVLRLAPRASLGLHLNATERFFPADAPAADESHPDVPKAIEYLHAQVDAYERLGITFRFATAHGYGRTTAKHPNNTTAIFRTELAKRGIRLFDGDVRECAMKAATTTWGIRDVGGSLSAWGVPNNGRLDHAETYRRLVPGTLILFLIHPGNYEVTAPISLGLRNNLPDRADIRAVPKLDELPSAEMTGVVSRSSGVIRRWLDEVRELVGAVKRKGAQAKAKAKARRERGVTPPTDGVTYEAVLRAMTEGGVQSMDEAAILAMSLRPDCPNLLLLHDIDLLTTRAARENILKLAKIEGDLGLAGVFNFLPVDDQRYRTLTPEEVVAFMNEVLRLAPRATLGLHLNATERFFPADAPAADESHPDIPKAIAYLHQQLDDYAKLGVTFRLGTAHGYGRTTAKEPNNASAIFERELRTRGVELFDGHIRATLQEVAVAESRLRDVGGTLAVRRFPNDGRPDRPETYRGFVPGSLINFLIHPGNYDVAAPLPLGAGAGAAAKPRSKAPPSAGAGAQQR
jgi:Sulfotransferase domain